MSADEFAVLINNKTSGAVDVDSAAHQLADKIQIALKYPIQLGEDEISASSSIGITTFPINTVDLANKMDKHPLIRLN
jgi:GGDEF domain-containing protein